MMKEINIIGGGLAGSEAALQFADANWSVNLYEMRPFKMTEAHQSEYLAELVCSNSLKSMSLDTGSGLLKTELNFFDCKLLKVASEYSVPAGKALAVDRKMFAEKITRIIENHPNIKLHRKEVTDLHQFNHKTILATGPLTSKALVEAIQKYLKHDNLYFYDAIAPIVSTDSINMHRVYYMSRYDKGEADYLNCPFSEGEYNNFINALLQGEKYQIRDFERNFFEDDPASTRGFTFYENCIPIEELAKRGRDTLRFGVMRPVGLNFPDSFIPEPGLYKKDRPYAVLQLRSENILNTAYNLVGCQTMLKYDDQKKIFRMIPGLEKAEFYRMGSIHRNTYINSPETLNPDLSLKTCDNIHVIGQLSGLEGYAESIFSGVLIFLIIHKNLQSLPATTMMQNLWNHLTQKTKNFQPMNANFGLLPGLGGEKVPKKMKKNLMAERSIHDLDKQKLYSL